MENKNPVKIGIIGCGMISRAYTKNIPLFRQVELTACADLDPARARSLAEETGSRALSVKELLESEVEIVLNLTLPAVHDEVNRQIIEAGKHPYCEKPLGLDFEEARATCAIAEERGLLIGCPPDTVLGAGVSTARRVIDDGWIGQPTGGTAFMLGPGPERWHPNAGFYYLKGGGPLFDMGPYYLTSLIHLLGAVKAVSVRAIRSRDERLASSPELWGQRLPVETYTTYSGSLEFSSGAIVTIGFSFDVQRHGHSPIEIYGSEGSLKVPDPNGFGGPVEVYRPDANPDRAWQDLPMVHGYSENSRFLGVADMAAAIREGRAPRCSGQLALHVLEIMTACEASEREQRTIALSSTVERPAPMPSGLIVGQV